MKNILLLLLILYIDSTITQEIIKPLIKKPASDFFSQAVHEALKELRQHDNAKTRALGFVINEERQSIYPISKSLSDSICRQSKRKITSTDRMIHSEEEYSSKKEIDHSYLSSDDENDIFPEKDSFECAMCEIFRKKSPHALNKHIDKRHKQAFKKAIDLIPNKKIYKHECGAEYFTAEIGNKTIFQCTTCNHVVFTQLGIKGHFIKEHSAGNHHNELKCCGIIFKDLGGFNTHKTRKHNKDLGKQLRKEYESTVCGNFKIFRKGPKEQICGAQCLTCGQYVRNAHNHKCVKKRKIGKVYFDGTLIEE